MKVTHNSQVVTLFKKIGQTPLDVINILKQTRPEFRDQKIAYAGRLDPMAEGLLIILVGDACKNRKFYERLPKTYEFEVLFGIETDTYDILGKIVSQTELNLSKSGIIQNISHFLGKHEQPYPPFSSPRVNGRPLFYWAREGKLNSIKIPKKNIKIYSFELNNLKKVSKVKLKDTILKKLSKVTGDFRQGEIIKAWKKYFEETNQTKFQIASFTIKCSSGTYVRSIAHELGKKLESDALALSIKRTKIGDYSLPSHSE